jgi:hypothetical protein
MRRFFTYEEYGAHWTTMSQDLTAMLKGFQGWSEYERGVEALSRLIASENNRESSSRKALSFSDLLIKAGLFFLRVELANTCHSLFSVSASTLSYSTICAAILPYMMTLRHMQSLKRPYSGFRRPSGKLTRRRMILGRAG